MDYNGFADPYEGRGQLGCYDTFGCLFTIFLAICLLIYLGVDTYKKHHPDPKPQTPPSSVLTPHPSGGGWEEAPQSEPDDTPDPDPGYTIDFGGVYKFE